MLDAFRYLLYTSYYAGIMLDAFRYLLCSKLCWHNRPEPIRYTSLAIDIVDRRGLNNETRRQLRPNKTKETLY